jgi:hypothetical protein
MEGEMGSSIKWKVMSIALISALLIFVSVSSADQWAITYGGDGNDVVRNIRQTTDGGYILLGQTNSFGSGSDELWILKLNADGSVAWQKTYGAGYGASLDQTQDGGYIVAGSYMGEMMLLKLNADGSVAWVRTCGGSDLRPSSVRQTADGGYVVAGGTYSFGAGISDIFVLKLDAIGTIAWQDTYGGSGADYAYSVQQTTDGGYIVAGVAKFFYDDDIWVLKLDADGTIAWQKTYGESGHERPSSIQQTSDGGYIVGASNGGENPDSLLLKLNSDGSIAWQKKYNLEFFYGDATFVQQTMDGGYIVTGHATLKLNSDGTPAWTKTYGDPSIDPLICSIQQTTDGGYVVAATSFSLGTSDVLVMKLDANGEGPDCNIISTGEFAVSDGHLESRDTSLNPQPFNAGFSFTDISSQETSALTTVVCPSPDHNNLSASPASLYFGEVMHFETSVFQTLTISNTGTTDIAVGQITITGNSVVDFSIYDNECSGRILAPSSSCTADVVFSPLVRGNLMAFLAIPSDDSTLEPTLFVRLTGTGIDRTPVNVMHLLSPNGGEVISAGSTYAIKWEGPSDLAYITLSYSTDNKQTWTRIVSKKYYPGPSNLFMWKVPKPFKNKGNCFIEILGYSWCDFGEGCNGIGQDRSDAPFRIEVVKVTSPDGGESLTSGQNYTITWDTNTTKKPVAKVRLKYSLNGGSTWKPIATITGNPGNHSWTVPSVTTTKTNCMIKVVLLDASGMEIGKDLSDGLFTIQPGP